MTHDDWIGSLPRHWRLLPLRRFIVSMCDGPFGSALKTEHYAENGVRVIRLQNIGQDHFLGADVAFVEYDYFKSLGGHDARPGDLLVAALGDEGHPVGRACVLPGDIKLAMVKADCFRVRLDRTRLIEPFVAKFLSSPVGQAELGSQAKGSTRDRINLGTLASTRVPIPPLVEQQSIVSFLDKEVTQLDRLVATKERVVRLLAEKRRALVTHAVTRGLDSSAPLRDSGIPWLDKIPAHWGRAQLRRYMTFITSGSRGWAEHYSETGVTFLRMGNLTRDSIRLNLSDVQLVDPPEGAEGARTLVREGDLLFSITAYLGSVALAPSGIGEAYVNQHIALVRLDQSRGLNSEYAAYAALSDAGQTQLTAQGYGGTKTQLALDDIRELWFPIPPVHEQGVIVETVRRNAAKIDLLVRAAKRTIALAKERRAALIAAAVTGQIDVEAAS